MRIAYVKANDITDLSSNMLMSIFDLLSHRLSVKKIDNSKCYSRCKMEALPTEIYQDIVDFQADVNRPIDMSIYRDFRKDAA